MAWGWKTHPSLDKNHIQPQPMGDAIYLYIPYTSSICNLQQN